MLIRESVCYELILRRHRHQSVPGTLFVPVNLLPIDLLQDEQSRNMPMNYFHCLSEFGYIVIFCLVSKIIMMGGLMLKNRDPQIFLGKRERALQ